MSKLNIIEAMKMPIGTLFEVIFNGEKIENNTMIIYRSLDDKAAKHIDWVCHPQDTFMKPYDFLINGVFIPIQQPVIFMEVVNSDKRCRVEHELIINKLFMKNYFGLSELISAISRHCTADVLRKIIKEGKWYIEESEELEDERLS